jgi:hypothetical protein
MAVDAEMRILPQHSFFDTVTGKKRVLTHGDTDATLRIEIRSSHSQHAGYMKIDYI